MPLYEYECKKCGHIYDEVRKIDERYDVKCPECGSEESRILLTNSRPPVKFPEGVWDIGMTSQHISSRRQLKEAMAKHNDTSDEFHQSYAKYLDGYGGY